MITHKNTGVGAGTYCVLFVFFVALFAFMPTTLDLDELIWVGASLLLLGVTILNARQCRITLYIGNSFLIFLFCIVLGIVSMLWAAYSTAPMMSYLRTKLIPITIGVICVPAYMCDEKSTGRVFSLMVWAAVIAAIRFCCYTPWSTYYRGDFGILLDPNVNYNNYTTPLCQAFIIAAYYAFGEKKKHMLLPLIILAIVTVVAGSRKTIALLPIIIAFYLVAQNNLHASLKGIFWAFVLIAGMVIAIMNIEFLSGIKSSLINAVNAYIFGQTENVGNSAENRMYLINTALSVWQAHPLLGIGWNNFRYANELGLYSHNNYAETLSCLGIAGFFAYYSQHVRTALIILRGDASQTRLSKLLFGALIGMLLLEVGTIPLYSREPMMIHLITLGMYDKASCRGVSITL